MLEINHIEDADLQIIRIQGEIDASNSVQLDEAIQTAFQSGGKRILVDCTELDYISSAGLGVFMSYLEDFKEEGVSFKIFGLSDKVFEVFKILGLDQLIAIYPDKTTAVSA
ncbi:STAS domain-containing protein [Algoriphagus namhaensis]